MIEKILLGLAVLAIGILMIPTHADAMTPYQQFKTGTPIDMIACQDDSMILMEAPDGRPACLTVDTANKLAERGYSFVASKEDNVPEENDNEPATQIAKGVQHRHENPMHSTFHHLQTIHDLTYYLHGFPVVGETGELVLILKHAETYGFNDHIEDGVNVYTPAPYTQNLALKPVRLDISSVDIPTVRIYDIVSNIGSDDPYVFAPYDYETETTIAEPGKTYTVKAKVDVLEEGFASFLAVGLDGDKINTAHALGKDESMPSWEYWQDGETYLTHLHPPLPVSGQGESKPRATPPPVLVNAEDEPKQTSEEIRYMLEGYIIEAHLKDDYPPEEILEELMHIHHTIPQMREFLANRMNYTSVLVEDLIASVPDDYYTHQNDTSHDPPLDSQGVAGQAHIETFTVSGRVTSPPYFFESEHSILT